MTATLPSYFSDLHIHIGSTRSGKPVKITASRSMTLTSVLEEASERKGMDMIGIIDAHVPEVLDELEALLEQGSAHEVAGGGIEYKQTSLILGSEVEIKEDGRGEAHFLCYIPTVHNMRELSLWLQARCKNITLSSQRIATTVRELQQVVDSLGGTVIPAHIFTPHKGMYGNCTDRMDEILDPSRILAVELGLSANTRMADRLMELHDKTFLTNSDAHSLAKIGREYQQIVMEKPCFQEWVMALKREDGRGVLVNYGLMPQLGKYHQTTCQSCGQPLAQTADGRCPHCGYKAVIRGVDERVNELANLAAGVHPNHRPPYVEQVPLEFIPGIGPKIRNKLYQAFGTEMNILHRTSCTELEKVVGEKLARTLTSASQGQLKVTSGGAGVYGRIAIDK
ncbi:endonuclease Q family protein [Brevibacillus sp. SYSU BS000544]|uniref:endonuclease Q family protein n=1 Tax=Brevibacillus sp. SYSU BS000544 TaxID=3416443 RepID=UPI003CE4767A